MIFARQNGHVVTYVGGDKPFVMMPPKEELKERQAFHIQRTTNENKPARKRPSTSIRTNASRSISKSSEQKSFQVIRSKNANNAPEDVKNNIKKIEGAFRKFQLKCKQSHNYLS